jgi:hypothetical protein
MGRALDSSGYRVCDVLVSGELHCRWWRGLAMPTEARFVDVAVGDGFVCGIVRVRQDPVRGLRHASDGCGHRVCGAGIGQVRQPLCCGALRLRGLCVQAQRCTSSSLTAEAEWWESKKNHVHQHRVLMELNGT